MKFLESFKIDLVHDPDVSRETLHERLYIAKDAAFCVYEEACIFNSQKMDYLLHDVDYFEKESMRVMFGLYNSRTLFVSFRGTNNASNVFTDALFGMTELNNPFRRVHRGFLDQWVGIMDTTFDVIEQYLRKYPGIRNININGHSLGGSIAYLCAYDLENSSIAKYSIPSLKQVDSFELVTFGAPRTGNKEFADAVNDIPRLIHNIRFVFETDVVPEIPTYDMYYHAGTEVRIMNIENGLFLVSGRNRDSGVNFLDADPDSSYFSLFGDIMYRSYELISTNGSYDHVSQQIADHSRYRLINQRLMGRMIDSFIDNICSRE
eukprot:CAMPEP_0170517626 /NCGR_PEP_ID=MMETSP0209-20121228/3547_1 /TAXON_ID=665100 ORGANISM="Litonotus pictus, Strain P1" /NCGR_SAMPLE_ID=MMETSP0209 /ASSEMBLY_ACC=CAM_ASM_000301 /LENGTH=319 /DNA_ID=CAMNT_0010802917 /DNA_START=96 /DNA_END=1055 /DNA_ORIENTATION=-